MVFPMLLNSTNTTTEILTTSGDIQLVFPTLLIVGFFLLFLYMAETRRDIGYTFFMMAISIFTFGDPVLSSITATNGVVTANLPLLMVFVSGYEMIMTFLLMRELGQRKKEDDY